MGGGVNCEIRINDNAPIRDWTCPCGNGYWDGAQKVWVTREDINNGRRRSRAEYVTHLKECEQCRLKAEREELIAFCEQMYFLSDTGILFSILQLWIKSLFGENSSATQGFHPQHPDRKGYIVHSTKAPNENDIKFLMSQTTNYRSNPGYMQDPNIKKLQATRSSTLSGSLEQRDPPTQQQVPSLPLPSESQPRSYTTPIIDSTFPTYTSSSLPYASSPYDYYGPGPQYHATTATGEYGSVISSYAPEPYTGDSLPEAAESFEAMTLHEPSTSEPIQDPDPDREFEPDPEPEQRVHPQGRGKGKHHRRVSVDQKSGSKGKRRQR